MNLLKPMPKKKTQDLGHTKKKRPRPIATNRANKMKTFHEYLIYDTIGMIGSVGGTLGMCIGFSFSNVLTNIINMIQKFLSPHRTNSF